MIKQQDIDTLVIGLNQELEINMKYTPFVERPGKGSLHTDTTEWSPDFMFYVGDRDEIYAYLQGMARVIKLRKENV